MQRLSRLTEQILAWIVGGALAVALLLTAHLVVDGHHLNDARLAPSAALLRGYDLYPSIGEGPLLGHIYGPFSAFLYAAPVALARTPAGATWMGSGLSVLVFFVPTLLLLKHDRDVDAAAALAAFACFWFVILQSQVFVVPAFNVHADAPALGFGALACVCLLAGHREHRRSSLAVAAGFMVLSVGSKQVMAALPLAATAYVWLRDGPRWAIRLLGFVVAGGIVALVVVKAFVAPDFRTFLFTAVTLPMRHPWKGAGGMTALGASGQELARYLVPPLCVLGAASVSEAIGGRLHYRRWKEWLRENAWVLLAGVALFNVPATLAGRVKVGGDVNALSFTLYFLYLAAAMAAARAASLRQERLRGWQGTARMGLVAMLVVLGGRGLPGLTQVGKSSHLAAGNPERAAFEFMQANPGTVYYPFNPLVSLMQDGGAHHFSLGIYFRELAGERISREHLHRWLPPRMQMVAIPDVYARRYVDHALRLVPNYRRQIHVPELPGWSVWVAD